MGISHSNSFQIVSPRLDVEAWWLARWVRIVWTDYGNVREGDCKDDHEYRQFSIIRLECCSFSLWDSSRVTVPPLEDSAGVRLLVRWPICVRGMNVEDDNLQAANDKTDTGLYDPRQCIVHHRGCDRKCKTNTKARHRLTGTRDGIMGRR